MLDPVAAWARHCELNQLGPESGPVQAFSYLRDGRWQSLLHSSLVNAAKDMARCVGLDPTKVAGHSFRRGGASFAFQAGVQEALIQRQGDWQSAYYKEYIVLSRDKALEATRMMFVLIDKGSQQPNLLQIQDAAEPEAHVGAKHIAAHGRYAR